MILAARPLLQLSRIELTKRSSIQAEAAGSPRLFLLILTGVFSMMIFLQAWTSLTSVSDGALADEACFTVMFLTFMKSLRKNKSLDPDLELKWKLD